MIILDTVNKSLEVLLAGAITTNQLPIVCSFVDVTTTTYTPGANDTQSNNTTAVTAAAAPGASTQRQVKLLTVYNADTVAATAIVRLNSSGTFRILARATLAVNSVLVYTDGEGFRVITVEGGVVTAGSSAGSNQQVLFNDGGIVAGDAGLTYDKATDTLSVAGDLVFPTSITGIRSNTSDGSDNKAVVLAGGGAVNNQTRGAFIVATGNEFGGGFPGVLRLVMGNVTGALIDMLRADGVQSFVMNENGLSRFPHGASITAEQSTTSTGTQNNFNLNGRSTYLRCNNASALSLTGFTVGGAAPLAGDMVFVHNIGSSSVMVKTQDTGSTADNRVICPAAAGQLIGANGSILFVYDATTSRWRMEFANPGAAVPIAFNAADFSASGPTTWTLTSGDVAVHSYIQNGKFLTVVLTVNTSTLGADAGALFIALSHGFSVATLGVQVLPFGRIFDGAWTAAGAGTNTGSAGNTAWQIFTLDASTISAAGGADSVYAQGSVTFEVD